MAGNPAPTDSNKLQQALEKAALGAAKHGATLHLKHDATRLTNAKTNLFDTEYTYDKAEIAWRARESDRSNKDDEIEAFVKTLKSAIVYQVGNGWHDLYKLADFPDNSTKIPETTAERIAVLERIPTVLTDNPTLVSEAKGLTVARANTLIEEWNTVLQAVSNAEGVMQTAEDARDAAYKAARKAFIGLVDELDEELTDPEDTRWWDFDLSRPADPETPAAPAAAPTAEAIGDTIRVTNLELPRRADACFVFAHLVGSPEPATRVSDRVLDQTTLTNLAPGTYEIEITYCGVNKDGSGTHSPPVIVIVT